MSGWGWLAVGLAGMWIGAGFVAVRANQVAHAKPTPVLPPAPDPDPRYGCVHCDEQAARRRHPAFRAKELAELEAMWNAS